MRTQGKNVLLHLENTKLNGWNVPKWKKLFYDVFDPHLAQYREDTIQKVRSHKMDISEEIKQNQILIFLFF